MTKFMTQTEYANHRGISQPRISKMISTGQIPEYCMKRISGKKLIDRDKADHALSENLDKIHNPNPEPRKRRSKEQPSKQEMVTTAKAAGTHGMSLSDAQQVQANYKAALLKLEYEEKSGKLVSVEQVEKEAYDCGRLTRDAILNVPSKIGAELASTTDIHKITEILNKELYAALDELTHDNEN